MKKNLLIAAVLFGMTSIVAQTTNPYVGINTSTPASTLDVTATTSNTAVADGVLVPRLTLAQLKDKDLAYKQAQNGALVFVTDPTGTPAGKTINVKDKGFYFYDQPTGTVDTNGKWVAVGNSSATPPTPTVQTFREVEADGTARNITEADFGNVVVVINKPDNSGTDFRFNFPTPTPAMAGKKFTIVNLTAAIANFTNNNNAIYKTNTLSMLQQAGSDFITDGKFWYGLGGN